MMGYVLFLGVALGAAGMYYWLSSQKELAVAEVRREEAEYVAEIKRLREQVARHIGKEVA